MRVAQGPGALRSTRKRTWWFRITGMTTSPRLWVRLPLGALSGLLAGFAALAVAELVSVAIHPQAGPIAAVGGAAIDRTPTPVKDWAIRHFGEDDKLVLQLGILAALAALAVVLGVVALRFRRIGAAGVLIFGVVGSIAAVTRPDSSGGVDALLSVVGALVAAALLYYLIGRLTGPPRSAPTRADAGRGPGWDRRGFVIGASAAAVGSLGVGALGRYLTDPRLSLIHI